MIEAFGRTDVGRRRKINEDSFLVSPETSLFAVCDGMGGHNAGEVASGLAIETLADFIATSAVERDVTWPWGLDANLSFDANRLKTAIRLANTRVYQAAEKREELTGMGTTVVASLVTGETADDRLGGRQPLLPRPRRRAHAAHARRLLGLGGARRGDPQLGRRRAPSVAERDHQGRRRPRVDRSRPDRAPLSSRGTSRCCAPTGFMAC